MGKKTNLIIGFFLLREKRFGFNIEGWHADERGFAVIVGNCSYGCFMLLFTVVVWCQFFF